MFRAGWALLPGVRVFIRGLYTAAQYLRAGLRGSLLMARSFAQLGFAAASGSTVVARRIYPYGPAGDACGFGYNGGVAGGWYCRCRHIGRADTPSIAWYFCMLTSEPWRVASSLASCRRADRVPAMRSASLF